MGTLRHILRRLRRDDDGAALVEFGVVLPVMLLVLGLTVEAARTFWSYQATVAGVRDATRYMGRSVQTGICDGGSADVSDWNSIVEDIVRNTEDGTTLFPTSIAVTSVTPTVACIAEGGFRLPQVPMVTVKADLEITYPFTSLFSFIGVSLPTARTTVMDTGRIFGA